MNQPRVYSYSASEMRSQVFFGILGALMLAGVGWIDPAYLPLVVLVVAGIIFSVWRASRLKTVVTEDGISTQGVFGEKSLRWNEVSRISGKGNEIKLHNLDGDVTLIPSTELPGYEEVIETIGEKRPDLFGVTQHPAIKKSMEYGLVLPLIALLTIALGVYVWSQAGNLGIIPFAAFLAIGLVVLGISAAAPQSVHVDGASLQVKYLTREKTIPIADIQAVELAYRQSKNSRMYFVRLQLASGESIRLSGLSPSLPIIYLVLKNWYTKNTEIGLTIQRN